MIFQKVRKNFPHGIASLPMNSTKPTENFQFNSKLNERLGIMSPHLLGHSFKKNYLIEEFIEGQNLFDLIKKSDRDMRKALSYQVGKLTGFVHSKNYSFFDNRPQNYIMNSNKIFRTDL